MTSSVSHTKIYTKAPEKDCENGNDISSVMNYHFDLHDNAEAEGNDLQKFHELRHGTFLFAMDTAITRAGPIFEILPGHIPISRTWYENMLVGCQLLDDYIIPETDLRRVVISYIKRPQVINLMDYCSLTIENLDKLPNKQILKMVIKNMKDLFKDNFQASFMKALWAVGLEDLVNMILLYFHMYPNQMYKKGDVEINGTEGFAGKFFAYRVKFCLPNGHKPVFFPGLNTSSLMRQVEEVEQNGFPESSCLSDTQLSFRDNCLGIYRRFRYEKQGNISPKNKTSRDIMLRLLDKIGREKVKGINDRQFDPEYRDDIKFAFLMRRFCNDLDQLQFNRFLDEIVTKNIINQKQKSVCEKGFKTSLINFLFDSTMPFKELLSGLCQGMSAADREDYAEIFRIDFNSE